MRSRFLFLMACGLGCLALSWSLVAWAVSAWTNPVIIVAQAYLGNISVSDDGARLVAVDIVHGEDKSRNIVVSEFSNSAWQPVQVIARNGVYDTGSFIWMPQYTHPVISGDGNTIAYVGWTGSTHAVYVVDRLPNGRWGEPVSLNTDLSNIHYWISLSRDGRTLALANYAVFFDTAQVYVTTRTSSGWSPLTRVSVLESGGSRPALSADGRRIVFIQNARVMYSERIGQHWSPPIYLTLNNHWEGASVDYPLLSSDGQSVVYWLVLSEGNTLVSKELYVIRRTSAGWGTPERVNSRLNVPVSKTDSAVALNSQATRLIYPRALVRDNTVSASVLEVAEWTNSGWQETTLPVAAAGETFEYGPRLTPDGMALTYLSSGAGIKRTTTNAPPAMISTPATTSRIITTAGGHLCANHEPICYEFAPDTFTTTVQITHTPVTQLPGPAPAITDTNAPVQAQYLFTISAQPESAGAAATAVIQPQQPVTVFINYRQPLIAGTVGLWRWEGNGWAPVAGVDDPEARLLTATLDQTGTYAIFSASYPVYLPAIQR